MNYEGTPRSKLARGTVRTLRQQDVPLATIAHRLGYTSEFAFAKAFKREYGLAPGGYRRGRGQEPR